MSDDIKRPTLRAVPPSAKATSSTEGTPERSCEPLPLFVVRTNAGSCTVEGPFTHPNDAEGAAKRLKEQFPSSDVMLAQAFARVVPVEDPLTIQIIGKVP